MHSTDRRELASFILGTDPDRISERVLLAPCWLPDSVGLSSELIADQSSKIWYCRTLDLTYIVTGVGAALCADTVMSLQYTRCKSILFIGSAGSLSEKIRIGDFAIPNTVYCAEGASRFLNKDLRTDLFETPFSADPVLTECMRNAAAAALSDKSYCLHFGTGISVESIFSQYKHLERFQRLGCTLIDMESSAVLAAASIIGIKSAVVYCISDNAAVGKPLYAVPKEETAFRKAGRKAIMPALISEFAGLE